jgi:hypothetical protein
MLMVAALITTGSGVAQGQPVEPIEHVLAEMEGLPGTDGHESDSTPLLVPQGGDLMEAADGLAPR